MTLLWDSSKLRLHVCISKQLYWSILLHLTDKESKCKGWMTASLLIILKNIYSHMPLECGQEVHAYSSGLIYCLPELCHRLEEKTGRVLTQG